MTQPPNSVKLDLNNKAYLRKELIQKRKGVDINIRQQWDSQICDHLLTLVQKHQLFNSTISVFSAINAEPQITHAFHQMHHLGIKLALPIVVKKNMPLQFSCWEPNDLMVEDEYGILIPKKIDLTSPDVLLIPCVGFNRDGYRIGYGGGFYDRTLANQPNLLSIGIAYQQSESLFAAGEYDLAMDLIITEKDIITFNPSN